MIAIPKLPYEHHDATFASSESIVRTNTLKGAVDPSAEQSTTNLILGKKINKCIHTYIYIPYQDVSG